MDQGRSLAAWSLAEPLGPLDHWRPGADLHLAAQIVHGVGATRMASAIDWCNWRADRSQPRYYHQALFARLRWRPPILLLPEINARLEADTTLSTEDRSDLLSFQAWALACLRDFTRATSSIQNALALTPDSAWTHIQHACLLEKRDCYEESLEAARRAMALRPVYRPAVLQTAEAMIHLGMDDDAIQLLRDAHQRTECGFYALRLQALYSEREDHQNGLWCLDEAEPRLPLMAADYRSWFAARRADFHYMAGDVDACLAWSDRTPEHSFQQRVARNIRRPDARNRSRVRLDVPFTRQHRMTCAPATLASLAKFWNHDCDHLEIAKAICHDGTPWHKERAWAVSNGFIAREFRFTREILMALIDRGLPFTLTTTVVASSHLQACIGYDDREDVALLRDPTNRHYGEILIQGLIDEHPTQGPRCMVMLPTAEAHRLDDLTLPDEALYDAQHDLAVALDQHDRWLAQTAISTMRAIQPDHPLTLGGEARFAGYLGHFEKQLQLVRKLAASFPDHQPTRLYLLQSCQVAVDPTSARELLEQTVRIPACDPVFISEYGEMLLDDARHLPLAGHFLRRAMRHRWTEGPVVESLARYEVKHGRFAEAARLRRFAATLSPTRESYANAYFQCQQLIGRTAEALEFLRERTEQNDARSADPWLTLAQALDSIHRDQEACDVLREAITRLPDDGMLKLHAGRMMTGWGEENRQLGLDWIQQARGKVAETVWLRVRAQTAEFLGDRQLALKLWRDLIASQPQALDAHRSLAMLIAEEQGRPAAIEFTTAAAHANPRLPGFWILLAEWLGDEAPGAALPALDTALTLDPDNVWTLRERATARFDANQREAALADAREAVTRAPRAPESHGVLTWLLHRNGDNAAALAAMREALRLRLDYTYGFQHLVNWSPDPAAARDALAFILNEMRRQVLTGDSPLEYQHVAAGILPPPILLDQLREITDQRPDMWQAWVARLTQCLAMDRQDEACQCRDHLTRFFPLLPRTWVEVANVARAAGNHEQEVTALRQAVDLSPTWDWAARRLGEVLERLGRHDEALTALERAIRHNPLAIVNHGYLADLLHHTGRTDEAFSRLLSALQTSPIYSWGWLTLVRWAGETPRRDQLITTLHATSERRSHQTAWWLIASDVWHALGNSENAIGAARSGLAIDPGHIQLRNQLAFVLGELERFDEALAVCDSGPDGQAPPPPLASRRAHILMRSGRSIAALETITSLLEREPDYAWGWQTLTEWRAARGEWQATLDAAVQWCRLNPDLAVAHGHLGLAAHKLGESSTAQRAFERAFRIDPGYSYAGRKLLAIQTEQREFAAARTTLSILQHYSPGPWIDCDALALTLREGGDPLPAATAMVKAAASHEPLLHASHLLVSHSRPLGKRWRRLVEKLITTGEAVSPAAVTAWVDLFPDQILRTARRLRKFKIPEASRNAGWQHLLAAIKSSNPQQQQLLPYIIRKNRQRFKQDPELWNVTGELLLVTGKHRATVKWLGDWNQRTVGVGPHTLVNLAAALDHTSGPAAASAVRAEGIRRFPVTDDNTLYLLAGQASYCAANNRVGEAAELVVMIDDHRLSDHYIGLACIGRSIVAASTGDEPEAREHYQRAIAKLKPWSNSRSVVRHLRPGQRALAGHLPWTAGKRRRLIKEWGGLPELPWYYLTLKIIVIAVVILISLVVLIAMVISGVGIPVIVALPLILRLMKKD